MDTDTAKVLAARLIQLLNASDPHVAFLAALDNVSGAQNSGEVSGAQELLRTAKVARELRSALLSVLAALLAREVNDQTLAYAATVDLHDPQQDNLFLDALRALK